MISHNKGKRYIECPECKRKRYCTWYPAPDSCRTFVCSKGHKWTIKLPTIERVSAIMQETLIPKLRNLFNRDDIFYRILKR